MHCPENIDGNTYVELVAAAAILLSQNLDDVNTFILAEFLQSVSNQMVVLAAFKDFDRRRRASPKKDPPEKKKDGGGKEGKENKEGSSGRDIKKDIPGQNS